MAGSVLYNSAMLMDTCRDLWGGAVCVEGARAGVVMVQARLDVVRYQMMHVMAGQQLKLLHSLQSILPVVSPHTQVCQHIARQQEAMMLTCNGRRALRAGLHPGTGMG
jgi:hypothetical protein